MPMTDTLVGKNPPAVGSLFFLPVQINQTDLLAGTKQDIRAPFDGSVEALHAVVQAAVTTGGTLTVAIDPAGDGSETAVVGIEITVANSATKGTVAKDEATNPSSTKFFSEGDLIRIIPSSGFDTAGAINAILELRAGPVRPA